MQEAKNSNMAEAKRNKNDEFYTQLTDIEKELKHYKDHFKDKVIFCNCDDPFESNFFKYFVLNFNRLGLKALMATSYIGSAISEKEFVLDSGEALSGPYKAVVTKVYDANQDGQIDMSDIEELFRLQENKLIPLHGDGDFRSEESIEMLKEADIVVTNPPFSLFREYVAQLVEYGKKFAIIGNKNAITYKEVFPMIKDEKLWLGYNSPKMFKIPSGESDKKTVTIDGVVYQTFGNIGWFTNMDIAKRHEELIFVKRYNTEDYPKYDNYDAINVDKVKDIPEDYDGIMGVPITFLDKYNPEQFEILGATESEGRGFSNGLWDASSRVSQPLINKERKYKRLFIKKKLKIDK